MSTPENDNDNETGEISNEEFEGCQIDYKWNM